jgi:hypothetical protein
MSRAAGGAYTLPSGNPVVTGTIISSTWGNTTLADIATALTDSLSRSGLGGMTAVLLGVDGAVGAPAYSFTNEPTTGLYRNGAGDVRFSRLGADNTLFGLNALTAPAFIPTSSTVPSNGMYLSAANTLALATNTLIRASINSTGNVIVSAPTAGVGVALFGFAGSSVFTVSEASVPKIGLLVGATERAFVSYTESTSIFKLDSDGSIELRPNNGTSAVGLTISGAGAVVVNAPTSGIAATINAFAGSAALKLLPGNSASIGMQILDPGANATELRLNTTNTVAKVQTTGSAAVPLQLLVGVSTQVELQLTGIHSTKIGDSASTLFNAGFLEVPQVIKNVAYTTVLSDAGKHIYHSDGTARTFTIDSNANVAYPIGTTLTFVNDASAAVNVTISITTDVLYFAVDGTTGSRTLARYGTATALKVTATRWSISGTGLT